MPKTVQIEEFLKLSETAVILDVRTSHEFQQGHIPGAINQPLFSNEERTIVGTIYKQNGRQPAILKGIELIGPRQLDILKDAIKVNKNDIFLLYCWRGGMRSASVAWLLELYGFKVYLLKGGYKFFRRYVLQGFLEQRKYQVLGGKTGSNKTTVLKELERQGEQIIDLENLAHHKGSSFGAIGEQEQPTQEHFENTLGIQLYRLDRSRKIWIEDESRLIGTKVIPDNLWFQMRTAKVLYIDIPFEERIIILTQSYGTYPPENLIEALDRIKKKLGPQNAKEAIAQIKLGNVKSACEIVLQYYDKTYTYGINKREPNAIQKISFKKQNAEAIAKEILKNQAESSVKIEPAM